jgi:hypothetical protein
MAERPGAGPARDDPEKPAMSLNPHQIAVFAICAILAITFHEAAHGSVALHFGDPF